MVSVGVGCQPMIAPYSLPYKCVTSNFIYPTHNASLRLTVPLRHQTLAPRSVSIQACFPYNDG